MSWTWGLSGARSFAEQNVTLACATGSITVTLTAGNAASIATRCGPLGQSSPAASIHFTTLPLERWLLE